MGRQQRDPAVTSRRLTERLVPLLDPYHETQLEPRGLQNSCDNVFDWDMNQRIYQLVLFPCQDALWFLARQTLSDAVLEALE